MTEQQRERDADTNQGDNEGRPIDDGGMPQPGPVETGVGREPWQDRSGQGDTGDMGDTGGTDVTPPDTNQGDRMRQSTGG